MPRTPVRCGAESRAHAHAALLALAFACAGPEPLELPDGCQPLLAGADCMLPYPSDAFLVADPTMPSGRRVELTGAAKMLTLEQKSADLHDDFASDGYSTNAIIVLRLPKPPKRTSLVQFLDDPALSMSPTSSTLLINTSTGERLAHFVDLDPRADTDERRAVVIHPLGPLAERTRYVVAVRTISAEDGSPIETPEGFRRLRDADPSSDLDDLFDRYESDVFPVVEAAGVARQDLALAFDFTTQSRARQETDLLTIRAATLAWLTEHPPVVSINHVTHFDDGPVLRVLEGTFRAPLFLDSDSPEGRMVRDTNGLPVLSGEVDVPFRAQIPASLRREGVGRAVLYGHGFFGLRIDVDADRIRTLSNDLGLVNFSIDWWGFSKDDVFVVVDALVAHPSTLFSLVDRLEQAMANWLVLAAAVPGPLARHPALSRTSSAADSPIYDPDRLTYVGASAGHILGGTLAALSPTVPRFVLNSGGGGLGQLMFRARPFASLVEFLSTSLPDPLDQQKYVAVAPEVFDRVDPAFWAPRVEDSPLEGNIPRRILMQTGLGDAQVPMVGAFFHANALRIPLVEPSPRPVYGLSTKSPPFEGSGLTIFDFGIDPKFDLDPDPTRPGNDVHDAVLQQPAAKEQIRAFLESGVITQPCDGACDPG
ncbi:MAG: hypothetical protein HY791_02280 [Deltaproteobacteria bacterium]|nr:hypothetical protein [Deltaproteobacteria bacterium]